VTKWGQIAGAEALIRWRHPVHGLLKPMDFIPLATRSGLIDKIGRWVLFNACKQSQLWVGRKDFFVSINLSASEFRGPDLLDNLDHAMKGAGNLTPDRLRIEVTETESMGEPEATIRRMNELLDVGIEVFVDDFGTGHSSLSYLKELPATTLKIDKSFLQNVDHQEDERRLLRALVDIARIRGKKVIIEGVSSAAQQGVTRSLSCDLLQGFLYSPPVSSADFEKLLAGNGDGLLATSA
jgi:EAL domain-containing protein (putative c-di-GMP-specific phosphodiesterase class I)